MEMANPWSGMRRSTKMRSVGPRAQSPRPKKVRDDMVSIFLGRRGDSAMTPGDAVRILAEGVLRSLDALS
jgi:hypothetical protein